MKAVHKQTGEVKSGSFEDLCDLDKRIWDLGPDEEPKPKPIWVTAIRWSGMIVGFPIYDWTELKGYYVGGY